MNKNQRESVENFKLQREYISKKSVRVNSIFKNWKVNFVFDPKVIVLSFLMLWIQCVNKMMKLSPISPSPEHDDGLVDGKI